MKRILIVDDELWIREGLKSKLQKFGFSLEEISEATNGMEALATMREKYYDIVISDICMNDMDGLKLCESLNEEFPNTQKIIISGYSEFDYAAKAIREGVVSYLLKPIDYTELKEAIQECQSRLDRLEQEKSREAQSHLEWIYSVSEQYELLLRDKNRIMELFSAYREGESVFGCLYFYISRHTKYSPGEILMILENGKGDYCLGSSLFVFKTSPYEYAVLVVVNGTRTQLKQQEEMEILAKQMERSIEAAEIPGFVCGISQTYHVPMEAVEESRNLMHHKVLFPDSVFIRGEQISRLKNTYEIKEAIKIAYRFVVKSNNYHEFSKLLHQIQKECMDHSISYCVLETVYQTLLSILWENTQENMFCSYSFPCKEPWRYHSVPKLFQSLREAGMSRMNLAVSDEKTVKESIAYQVKDFIEKHYHEPITLEQLAEENFVTPSYLSLAFKEVIGTNFLDYLNSIRLRVAKQLMRNPNYKIKTIASMTGFNDQHYFSRIFKKKEGCTPKEYMDRLQV